MAEKTEAQKRAQKTYMGKFVRVEIRMTPEDRGAAQVHAEAQGESVNGFINRAIAETIERDSGTAQEIAGKGPESTQGVRVVPLPSETMEAAQEAAEAAGQTVPDFIRRAVETQAQRDRASLKLGINPTAGEKQQ